MIASRLASLFFVCTLATGALAGCAAEADSAAPQGDVESEDDLSVAALAGRYAAEGGARAPTFLSLELRADKTFYADVDSGIRCVRAPCPSGGAIWGTYTAGTKYLTLRADAGAEPSEYYGRYGISRTATGLALTRSGGTWDGWSNTMKKAEGIFRDDATKITAESSGGGFAPPPPPGSTCARGAQKYTLDIASRALSFERCESTAAGPFAKTTGTKTLSAKESRAIVDAARAASIHTDNDVCGADKPMVSVRVTAPGGTKRYLDSFYACQKGATPYADGLDAILRAMADAS
jgi:hypothetical protein